MVTAIAAGPLPPLPDDIQDPDLMAALRLDPDSGVPLRELADFSDCPFRATVRHRLNLRSNRPVSLIHRLVNLPGKASLHLAADEDEMRARLGQALNEKIASTYVDLEPWEAHLLRAAGERLVDAWVSREKRSRDAWPRTPWKVEGFPVRAVRLGEGGTRDTIRLGGGQVVRVSSDPLPVYQVGDLLVVRLDEGSTPKTALTSGTYTGTAKWLRHGLLLGLLSSASSSVGLEIEALGDDRMLLFMRRAESQQALPTSPGLLRHRFSDYLGPEHKAVAEQAIAVLKAMLAGTAKAKPGLACANCDFGGLCRRSQVILGDET